MLIEPNSLIDGKTERADVCVVGTGPAGLVLAMELERLGLDVIVLESGQKGFSERAQHLSAPTTINSAVHASMWEATRRQLGGTSAIWGGRCVPLDPIDFSPRDYVESSGWPIQFGDVANYYAKACEYSLCGDATFTVAAAYLSEQESIVPGLPDDDGITSSLERWSLPTDFWKAYEEKLLNSERIKIFVNSTCVGMGFTESGSDVTYLKVKCLGGVDYQVVCGAYVVAAGGVESTRLLLDAFGESALDRFGGTLGRYYMGHISGKIADVHFTTPPKQTIYGYEKDSAGVYCRRRFTLSEELQQREELMNFAAWLDHPPLADSNHHNGILSISYLMLASPLGKFLAPEAIIRYATEASGLPKWNGLKHLRNVVADLGATVTFIPTFVKRKYWDRRKVPGLALYNKKNRYALHYHAEHAPHANSRIELSDEKDELGRKKVNIQLHFTSQDVGSVVRSHEQIDAFLQRHNCGKLIYRGKDKSALVEEQARDGFHQIGTTRMANSPKQGVVNQNCQVFGVSNLFVSSSSVFPTSGQANPTLTIIALSLRLAEHLKNGRVK